MIFDALFPKTWNPLKFSLNDLDGLTDAWIFLTAFFALGGLLWAIYRSEQARRMTRGYVRFIKGVNSSAEFDQIRHSFPAKQPLWKEFNHLLVNVSRPGSPLDLDLKRCGDASEVFNATSLGGKLIGNRFLLSIPAILTGFGVLGTFVGLQIGIGSLELGENIAELNQSIEPLIKGCSTAFATSVWGVFGSLIFTIADKFLEWRVIRQIQVLHEKLNRIIPRYTPEESMIELQRSSNSTEKTLSGLAVAIGEQMQIAIDRLGGSITQAVRDSLGGQAQDLGKMSADLISSALTEQLGQLKESVNGMTKGFQQEFTSVSERLTASVSGFESLLSSVDSSIKESQSLVNSAVERLVNQEDVVKGIAESANQLRQAAAELATMKESLIISASNNESAATAQKAAATTNEKVAAQFQSLHESIVSTQEAITQGAQVISSLGHPLLELKDVLKTTPTIFSNQAEEMANRDEKRASLLLQQTEQLAQTVAQAASKFGEIEGLSLHLSTSTQNLLSAGRALESLASGIERASEQHQSAANAAQKAAVAGERTAEIMQPIASNIICLTDTLTAAGETFKEGASATGDLYINLANHHRQWFNGVEIGLTAMKDRLQQILDTYGDAVEGQTREQMSMWTKAVEESLRKFASQVQILEGSVNDLTATINRK